ncbi:cohesin complex subunit SCC1 [Exophiala viscosa]|uniref:cohesin complex subunit SCC1 n=1 Tax=Exophiala viscosa TaxID=2486360 RepID=UPI00219DD386|nr:cohesin complex subunit SCC1 [Exophiala viscosa]
MALASHPMADSQTLLTSLADSTSSFLQPPTALHLEALACVKNLLDPLAADVADAQKLRRDENRRKRKRADVDRQEEVLHLRQVYTSGLGVKQVWEQARRVLEAACSEVERDIASQKEQIQSILPPNGVKGHVTASDDVSDEEDLDDEEGLLEDEDLEDDLLDEEALDEEEDYEEEDALDEDMEDIEAEDEELESVSAEEEPTTYVPDPNGLNDGFFSIDDFNRQTQFLEQQDVRGEDDNPSDEDEIDWNADPLSMPLPKATITSQKGKKSNDIADVEDGSEEEDGPTFGDADLDADDSDEDMVDGDNLDLEAFMPTLENTNEVRYADFFAPPPKQLSKTKRRRALPKTQPAPQTRPQDEDETETDMQRAIADVRRDLLDSDDDGVSDAESGSDDGRPSTKNMSTHEKQQAAIGAEIRRLEAANVAKRDWTLSGEARAAERPLNSLIEEDLEFERTGKPVPVITAEVSEEIEQLIKRRILAREFDEVTRRHPDALGTASDTRRGRTELLDDTKPQSSLAEVYEQEHLRATDPGYIDKRSAATKKQHDEISRLWKEVSNQLDLLSNLHFKPKRLEAEIKTVEDKPTISMEDARPMGLGVNADESMLAPQEVYRPGETKARDDNGEIVVRKGGAAANKEEMSREEKLRRRRREKERVKKANAQQGKSSATTVASANGKGVGLGKKSKTQDKADILSDLQKGNVKVIDKKGELQDLGGKKGRKGRDASQVQVGSGGVLKL